jgi:hypothetical protein
MIFFNCFHSNDSHDSILISNNFGLMNLAIQDMVSGEVMVGMEMRVNETREYFEISSSRTSYSISLIQLDKLRCKIVLPEEVEP